MQYFRVSFKKIILIFFLGIISVIVYTRDRKKPQPPKEIIEFRIEFKDVNITYFHYGFDEPACDENHTVLIATPSAPNASDLRMGIRNSWKYDIPSIYTHKFFIGSTSDETLQNSNEYEAYKYGDIVFTNITDSNENASLKMVSLFQWQQYYCPNVTFVLKVDDGNVLDVSRFQHWLNLKFNMFKKNYNESIILGYLHLYNPVSRDPHEKRYVPYEAYQPSHFPSYENGASYLIPPYSINKILKGTKNHIYLAVDDAFLTGILADPMYITRINASRHFAKGNPLNPSNPLAKWDHECDDNGVPFLFTLSDENGEIKHTRGGYAKSLKKLKELSCSSET